MQEIVFYQIPISHFCEKVHWALDFKGLPYNKVSVNPFTNQELAAVSERPTLPWHYSVADTPAVNAFALPGGPIYINRGVIEAADCATFPSAIRPR